MRLGILGGTFNPIHNAHLQIARDVLNTCGLDRILFIPSADPPHKPVDTPFHHRLAMVEAAIAGQAKFAASDMEEQRGGKSYSVDTLSHLKQMDPAGERFFIIGMDSYRDIGSWRSYEKLFQLAHLVVMTRPGVEINDPLAALPVAVRRNFCYDSSRKTMQHTSGNSVIFLEETRMDISSTEIRTRVAAGQSIDHLVPAVVADYISDHALYQSSGQGS